MGSKNCMNEVCRATVSSEWKKGWSLKSGGFATLCYNCGSAYKNSVFCETFHSNESGWRECRMCRKRIHCGCVASRYLHEYMDFGGIGCITCVKRMNMDIHPLQPMQIASDTPTTTFVTNGIIDVHHPIVENTKTLLQLTEAIETNDLYFALDEPKKEDFMLKTGESTKHFPNFSQPYNSSTFTKDNSRPKQAIKTVYKSSTQPSLNYSLNTYLNNNSSPVLPFKIGVVEGGEHKGSSKQGQKTRIILPKCPKPSPVAGGGSGISSKASCSQVRVARPPAEGRGRNQLLPRYWPRITDQELQQLSVDLKSTIVPLFEKILSSSDAGRIGRLVLPKACAEAYFPAINQSEGIPLRIQDIKGKEWTFQFRFWPNNNSRMYVLEGVTPCIQSMQLQAGDTVTFSRIDPGGQLVVGSRKETNNAEMQDSQASYTANGDSNGETSFSGATDNGLSMTMSKKKKARNIKNKRVLMCSDDATELRITWEEAQELLRPSPNSKQAVFMVEHHEFEEFEEPPVFGKRTLFTSRPSGEQEQLAQCDTCSKWRRLPLNALLSANWTCSENIWDSSRSSCPAPEDINPRDLEFYFGINKDPKQRRISEDKSSPSGLDALATAAVLGDNITEMGESSVGATTRHPRHRPGCSCIVCIQPPSGTGKHESMCKCNVCLTVKRRFKTLMMRKKKRQREAELAREEKDKLNVQIGSYYGAQVGLEGEDIDDPVASMNVNNNMESEMNDNGEEIDLGEEGNGLDLNCDPHREDEILAEAARMSLTSLMNAATLPIGDVFMEETGVLPSLRPCLVSRNADDVEKNGVDGGFTEGNVEPENNREGS